MAFTRQAPPILNALWQGGLSAASAAAVQNLLGQCRSPLRHNGPIRFDYTTPSMRLITPETATQEYPGSQLPEPQDFPEEEEPEDGEEPPGPKPRGFLPAEHLPNEPQFRPGPGEQPGFPLQPGMPTRGYFAGKYLYIDRDKREIGLECNDKRRHAIFPGNLNIAGTVNSVDFFASRSPVEFVDFTIKEKLRSTDFTVTLKQLALVEFVTGVDLSDPSKIIFHKKQGWVFKPEDISADEIPLVSCDEETT